MAGTRSDRGKKKRTTKRTAKPQDQRPEALKALVGENGDLPQPTAANAAAMDGVFLFAGLTHDQHPVVRDHEGRLYTLKAL